MKSANVARPENDDELNLTSMIDVIFLLLIFFVFTSNFKPPEKKLETPLSGEAFVAQTPKSQTERDLDKILVLIGRTRDGGTVYQANGALCKNVDELEKIFIQLADVARETPVSIAPEPNVTLEATLDAYDCARRAGLAKINFVASRDALAQ